MRIQNVGRRALIFYYLGTSGQKLGTGETSAEQPINICFNPLFIDDLKNGGINIYLNADERKLLTRILDADNNKLEVKQPYPKVDIAKEFKERERAKELEKIAIVTKSILKERAHELKKDDDIQDIAPAVVIEATDSNTSLSTLLRSNIAVSNRGA